MRDPENIAQVLTLEPDFMGFIFYRESPRYVGDMWQGLDKSFPKATKRVGVFVDESQRMVGKLAEKYELDYLQLHGNESVEYCEKLSKEGYGLIKVFSLKDRSDLDRMSPYIPWVSYFMFDTPSKKYGGTGQVFDWSLLQSHHHEVPFVLSGGLSLENIEAVQSLRNLNLAAIDVNSRFETSPGLKDVKMLKRLKNQLSKYEFFGR